MSTGFEDTAGSLESSMQSGCAKVIRQARRKGLDLDDTITNMDRAFAFILDVAKRVRHDAEAGPVRLVFHRTR